MMPGDPQGDEAARLEAALSRIQAAAGAASQDRRPRSAHAQAPSDLAEKLDSLIAELRALLAPPA